MTGATVAGASLMGIDALAREKSEHKAEKNGKKKVLGVNIPKIVIPVAPGKNLTVISEVIAMNTLMKLNGQNIAKDFNENLMQKIKAKAKGEFTDELLDIDIQHWSPYE